MSRNVPVIIGILGGIYSAGSLMFRGNTPWMAVSALVAPILAGAIAASWETNRAGRELEVEEAFGVGSTVGLAGGFILAVPFSLLVLIFSKRHPEVAGIAQTARHLGTLITIGMALMLMLVFLTLSVIAAVVAARFTRRDV